MRSNKENWDAFKEPVKQEIKNIKDSVKYGIEDTIIDMKEGNISGGSCLKRIAIWAVIIILFCAWINSCTDDNSKNNAETAVSEQSKTVNNEPPEMAEDYSQSSSDLSFLDWQNYYAANNGITLNHFEKEQKVLASNLENLNSNFVYATIDNILGADRYKITSEQSEYLYAGEIEDNYANGFGIILKYSDFGYGTLELESRYYNIAYIGHFKKGRFDGYGLEFFTPDGNDYAVFKDECSYQPADVNYSAYYLAWLNYVKYDGMFENGSKNGLGNSYYADLELRSYIPDAVAETILSDVQYDEIIVGNFKNGELNGKCKNYTVGTLIYDGEMKNGVKNGFGCSYDNNGNLEYEGEFKNDMKDGKGTLYDTDGNVIYKGEWKMDDYK